MTDIVAFLTAQLNADEARAQQSGPARVAWLTFRDDAGQMLYTTVAADNGGTWIADGHELAEPTSARVVYDPAQVLREVAAKRAIVVAHWNGNGCPICIAGTSMEEDGEGSGYEVPEMYWIEPCPTMRLLAATYAKRPGYQPSWQVEE